ncbi:MAG: DUF805 domain-containing protein [Clostridiaceae bacterium]|jgi:uncharacterized membrane protein YhaH (DUF805 family)|nr:DUF805 domain-containing protein [Clostridiaceae bacterium]
MSWFLAVVQKYAVFQGRARRKEYWMFILFYIIFAAAASIIDSIIGTYLISPILSLALLVPSLAVLVRRLHDIGKSGAWFFISLIPLIGSIWLLILLATEGTRGDNQYGPDPKY